MVIIDKTTKNENRYADLNDYPTDGSAMMVQTTNNKQVNGITIVEVLGEDGTPHATTILIDYGFTGYAIMSHSFAEKLAMNFNTQRENQTGQQQAA